MRRRHAAWLGLLALLTTAGFWSIGTTVRDRSAPAYAAGDSAPVHARLGTRPPAASGPRRLVAFGDSVAAAGACGCRGYPELVADKINRQRAHPLRVANLAVSGATTQDVLDQVARPRARRLLNHSRYVLVEIGANDFRERDLTDPDCQARHLPCQHDQLVTMTANLDTILSVIDRRTPRDTDVAVLGYWNVFKDGKVGSALGSNYVTQSRALTKAVNARVRALASLHHDLYVETVAPFLGPDGTQDPTHLLVGDGDHPNAAGQKLLAQSVLQVLG